MSTRRMLPTPGFARSKSRRNDDSMLDIDDAGYLAIVNPTGELMQASGHGKRAVFLPGDFTHKEKKKRCIQFWKKKIAKKMQWNKRKYLETYSVEDGRELVRRAHELGNFFAAYAELVGSGEKKAAVIRREARTTALRRRQLMSYGFSEERVGTMSPEEMIKAIRNPAEAWGIKKINRSIVPDDYKAPAGAPMPPFDDDVELMGGENDRRHTPDTLDLPEPPPLSSIATARGAELETRREKVKEELKKLGVKFHGRTSTENLERRLEKAISEPSSLTA